MTTNQLSEPAIPLEERFTLSPAEVQKLFNISRATFYRKIAPAVFTGEVSHYWIGNCLRIVRTSLLTYLERRREDMNNG